MSAARGAQGGVQWPGGVRAWARRHAYSLLSSLGALIRHPLASLMTVVVLAITLSLPTGLYTTLENAQRISDGWERLDTLSVFLELSAGEREAMQMASLLSTWPGIVAVDPISPETGLAELTGRLALEDVSTQLESNPLPWVLEVTPASGQDPEVLSSRLGAAEGVVIGNTIRMDIHNRREEIRVLALVGATDGFVRRPFLYTGFWYGLAGGVSAWLIVQLALWVMTGPVQRLSGTYASDFSLIPPPPAVALILVLGSGLLGVLGAWLAVGRHLRGIHPA